MRYRLVETLRGDGRKGDVVLPLWRDYDDVDAKSTHSRHALLVGRWQPDGTFQPVKLHQVDALRGGGWGLCADFAYLSGFDDAEALRRPLDFAAPFGDASRFNADGRAALFDPGVYSITGNDVHCALGVRAEDAIALYAGEPMPPTAAVAAPPDEAVDSERTRHAARRRERREGGSDEMRIVMANPNGERLVSFVGELLSIADTEAQCGPGCWQFDTVYAAHYRPRETYGPIDAGTSPLRFTVWTHSTPPSFAWTPMALLFLWQRNDSLQLAKYEALSVDRTVDGEWAVCGDPYTARDALPEDAVRTVPLRFRAEVVFDDVSRWSAQRIAETYPPDTYTVVEGKVRCHRGALARDIARIRAATIHRESDEHAAEAARKRAAEATRDAGEP